MGITWRSAMPLLSTLAALVIIVHSAEENLDREHRYELRPRFLDTRSAENEQPWRVVRSESLTSPEASPPNLSNESQDEPPVRRRIGRKRKRRPPSPASDEIYTTPAYRDEIKEITDAPVKRRKKLSATRWPDDETRPEIRPIRRRGQRRKRPSLQTWPELSEFSSIPRDRKLLEDNRDTMIQTHIDDDDLTNPRYLHKTFGDSGERRMKNIKPVPQSRFVLTDDNTKPLGRIRDDQSLSEFSIELMDPAEKSYTENDEYEYKQITSKMHEKSPGIHYNLDKVKDKTLTLALEVDKYFDFKSDYVSFLKHKKERNTNKKLHTVKEFIENIKSQDKVDDSKDYIQTLTNNNENIVKNIKKCKDKLIEFQHSLEEHKTNWDGELKRETGPIDPLTLKDILKRSNGTSLSELLQQYNLTLADLLNGNEKAISLLKSKQNSENTTRSEENSTNNMDKISNVEINDEVLPITTTLPLENNEKESINDHEIINNDESGIKDDSLIDVLNDDDASSIQSVPEQKNKVDLLSQEQKTVKIPNLPIETEAGPNMTENEKLTVIPAPQERASGMVARRRFPGTIRRKLRMRPMLNNTFKSQINRDLIALSARRYVHHNRRNVTKAKEWRQMIPLMLTMNTTHDTKEQDKNSSVPTTSVPEETTTEANLDELTEPTISNEFITINNVVKNENGDANLETTTIMVEILATELDINVTEKAIAARPLINPPGARRLSFNNRLKKKRMKQRTSTTGAPPDELMNILELGDLVAPSENIDQTEVPRALSQDDYTETATELEDFLTTHSGRNNLRSIRKSHKSMTATKSPLLTSTEETAKIEIEEILNDTRTSLKLSKILRERNMTLSELFEHRERGSSHVHLADIFHNASREPNPPEPFLSKSLIEPISKETYPLRALLDANLHDPATKATTEDPILLNHINIPVIMDFGNNVNENAENMGIMSLFNNFTKNRVIVAEENSTLQTDSKGTPYKSTVIAVNATDDDDTTRESRMLDDNQDMISWNEIFSMIRKNHKNETKAIEKLTNEISPAGIYKKITLEEDVDGDGVIVLEDLQQLKESDHHDAFNSEEKIEFHTLERAEILEPGILNKTPSSAKSVTVATASIVGLAMILFLLTYAALKWRQQRTVSHKKTFCDERIPSPVFENRKVKKNCSSRSISPMLPTSNIYTMNTLDSQNGKDSPEYMWDTLRKPFQ